VGGLVRGDNSTHVGISCYNLIQMAELLESAELLAFVTAFDAGSLAFAARQLGIPRATLGRRLARLEARLSVRLIHRSTRELALTDAGTALLGRARVVLEELRIAEASVERDDSKLQGTLRVSVPSTSDARFANMLVAFASRNPELRLEVRGSAQFVDLRRGDCDVVIRAGTDPGKGLVGRVLARDRLLAVASPAYLKQHGVPRSVKALAAHRCLVGYARGEVPDSYWPLQSGGRVHVQGAFAANSPELLLRAAKQGMGIALVPLVLARTMLKAAELVPVLDALLGTDTQVRALYLDREFVAPSVRAFVQHVAEWVKREPLLDGDR
jgi:DNA-binding transcriptional LysR family regulator